jgi:xanthine phosphoribosyltransferase
MVLDKDRIIEIFKHRKRKNNMNKVTPVDLPVTWQDIHRLSKELGQKLLPLHHNQPFKGVVAVTRGGLVPACLVAREINIRTIETIAVSSYDAQNQRELSVLKAADAAGDGAGWLVVDDLSDTGNTFRALRDILPKAHFACLYVKPDGKPMADSFVTEVTQNTWIFLPWEDQEFPPHIHAQIGTHLD